MEKWWDKYKVSLTEVNQQVATAESEINIYLQELGYIQSYQNSYNGERVMQMSFDLTDDVVQQLKTIPNLDNFVNRVIQKALLNQAVANDKHSKWALLAQEIESNPALNLDGYSEQLKKDTLEVRENFIFPSDENSQ